MRVGGNEPMHVTMRIARGLPSLRKKKTYAVVKTAIQVASARAFQIFGSSNSERFGQNVALLQTPEGPAIAVGSPRSDFSGVPLSDGVGGYSFGASGLSTEPPYLFGGESVRTDGQFGDYLNSGEIGGRPVIAVGAWQASGVGPDQGASYVLDLGP